MHFIGTSLQNLATDVVSALRTCQKCTSKFFLSLFLQAPPWYYYKKRYPPSYGPDGKPRPRVHNVQLAPSSSRYEEDESEEEVRLLDSSSL